MKDSCGMHGAGILKKLPSEPSASIGTADGERSTEFQQKQMKRCHFRDLWEPSLAGESIPGYGRCSGLARRFTPAEKWFGGMADIIFEMVS